MAAEPELNKHLWLATKETVILFPRDEAESNIEVEGKQNSLIPEEPVIKCFVIPPDSKVDAIAYNGYARKIERLPKPTCPIEKSRR